MDKIEARMDKMEQDINELKEGQKRIEEKMTSAYEKIGEHELDIRTLRRKKIL
jgi:hypothetical protein